MSPLARRASTLAGLNYCLNKYQRSGRLNDASVDSSWFCFGGVSAETFSKKPKIYDQWSLYYREGLKMAGLIFLYVA